MPARNPDESESADATAQGRDPLMGGKRFSWPRARHLWAMLADVAIVLLSYYLMLNFRSAGNFTDWISWSADFGIFAAIAVVVHLVVNWFTGVYSIVGRYMSLSQAIRLAESGLLAFATLLLVVVIWPLFSEGASYLAPRSVVIGGSVLAMTLMVGSRFSRRVRDEITQQPELPCERLLLVGAGQAADMLIREIKRTPSLGLRVVGLVDDRSDLQYMSIQGLPILGRVADTPALVKKYEVTQVIVAIPSATAEEVVSIYRLCKAANVPIKILPSLAELVSGRVSLGDARDLDIKDLLGRPSVETDIGALSEFIQGHTVLVTGAGGSIGSELCRQIARFDPGRLVMIDHDESSLYDLHERLQSQGFRRYVLYPASILQREKLEKIFALHRPRLVFHAAAYKHVPLMELSPDEAVLNNVKGTLMVAEMAARYGTERFINISTDKAVEPCNVMGATKRIGELIVRDLDARHPGTLFASVRFGNVLGSQGSVIPIFKSQIENGGPLVITHPEMTRYFMLIEEAVQLVLQAAIMLDDTDGDRERSLHTFVLEMGAPVSIIDLAQRMIDFYWKDEARSLGVEFSGLRPGEKLDERLTYMYEEALPTTHPLVKQVCARAGVAAGNLGSHYFESSLRELIALAELHGDRRAIMIALQDCVPEYAPLEGLPMEKPLTLTSKSGFDSR
jgi:FlaA1/EpsC-like NDP-sugar epimerase